MKYIVVLGHKLDNDGKLSSDAIHRLTTAINVFNYFSGDKFIVSGGNSANRSRNNNSNIVNLPTEAFCMKRFLQRNGIDGDHIITEDKSISTVDNIINIHKILPNHKVNIFIISSDYHIPRVKLIVDTMFGNSRDTNNYIYYPAITTKYREKKYTNERRATNYFLKNNHYI